MLVGKDVRSWNSCALLVGKQNGAAAMESGMEVLLKIKNRTTIQLSNSIFVYLPKENKTTHSKSYMNPYVHCKADVSLGKGNSASRLELQHSISSGSPGCQPTLQILDL